MWLIEGHFGTNFVQNVTICQTLYAKKYAKNQKKAGYKACLTPEHTVLYDYLISSSQ